jgi:SAM-dependent methyltransferase
MVIEPWTDFEVIYDEAYYRGRGANPHDDYFSELEGRPVRRHAWRGMHRAVAELTPVTGETRWLDYGCGLGGFVVYLRGHGVPLASGHDTGFSADGPDNDGGSGRGRGARDLSDLNGTFDVITAIEVIEHTLDPVGELRSMYELLRPGGLLFLTTGNAYPFRDRLEDWWYVTPDVHIGFFEPETLELALEKAGFQAQRPGFVDGWDDVIRYKVVHMAPKWLQPVIDTVVPWKRVAPYVDKRYGVTAHPVGRRL